LQILEDREEDCVGKDACFRPPIIVRSHDLHAGDNRGVVDEIASSHKRDYLSLFFGSWGFHVFWFVWPSVRWFQHQFLLDFLPPFK